MIASAERVHYESVLFLFGINGTQICLLLAQVNVIASVLIADNSWTALLLPLIAYHTATVYNLAMTQRTMRCCL